MHHPIDRIAHTIEVLERNSSIDPLCGIDPTTSLPKSGPSTTELHIAPINQDRQSPKPLQSSRWYNSYSLQGMNRPGPTLKMGPIFDALLTISVSPSEFLFTNDILRIP